MFEFYASDDLVLMVNNAGLKPDPNVLYAHDVNESLFIKVVKNTHSAIYKVKELLKVDAVIRFALMSSMGTFRVFHERESGIFVVLVSWFAHKSLSQLCIRLQTLDPVASRFGLATAPVEDRYKNLSLLNIIDDIVLDRQFYLEMNKTIRQQSLIFVASFTYAIAHEIAHIAHGHLDFKQSESFKLFAVDKNDESLTSRTLEMDADCSATTSVTALFENYAQHLFETASVGHLCQSSIFRSTREQGILGIFIAQLFMDSNTTNFRSSSHPNNYARFLNALGVSRIFLSGLDASAGDIPESMRSLLVSLFMKLSGSLAALKHPIASNTKVYSLELKQPLHSYSLAGEAYALRHLEPLHGRWAQIRPYLEKFKRGGQLAPAQVPPR